MKPKKCIHVLIFMVIILGMIVPHSASAASTTEYGILIGDKENDYSLHDDLIILSPKDDVMVKAFSICNEIGLSYSYDKGTKKITIKNKDTGKSLVFTRDSKTYTYYNSKTSKGEKKTADYKCYYDKASKCYVIHNFTLKDLLSYTLQELDEGNDYYNEDYKSLCDDYYSQGYNALIFYNKYWKTEADLYASIKEPTAEMIERLKEYVYAHNRKPMVDYDKLHKDFTENVHKWILNVFKECTLLELNDIVYTNEHLTYVTQTGEYVIRFVLQTTLYDGSIEEQDMEYLFTYSGWDVPTLYNIGFNYLGNKRTVIEPIN